MPESSDRFSGVWRLNPERSVFDERHRPSQGTLRFEQDGQDYVMHAEGVRDGNTIVEPPLKFIFDGHDYPVLGCSRTDSYIHAR